MEHLEYPEWFFMWATGKPYITSICGWTRKDVIRQVEEMNLQSWKKTYARGGRVVRVKLQVCPTPRAADGGNAETHEAESKAVNARKSRRR